MKGSSSFVWIICEKTTVRPSLVMTDTIFLPDLDYYFPWTRRVFSFFDSKKKAFVSLTQRRAFSCAQKNVSLHKSVGWESIISDEL